MTNFLKFHRLAFILSIAVGAIYISHNFFVPFFLGSQKYYPVAVDHDESGFYGPRANAVYNGEWIAGDISVAENMGSPSTLPILNPIILGVMGKLLGSIKAAFIFSDFLFPLLIFLALYFLCFEIFSDRLAALLFSSIFIFTPEIWLFIPPVSGFYFHEFLNNALLWLKPEKLYFSRFEYPKITFLFFASGFYFTLRALKRNERASVILAGIAFGLMFYTYLYDWSYFFVCLGITAFFFALGKDWNRFKIIFQIIIIGSFISIFYWINFLNLHSLPQYHDIFLRMGMEISHNIRLLSVWKSYLRNICLIILIWFAWRGKNKIAFNFITASLLAYFIVVNIQVVLGFNPNPDHWYRITFLPVGLAFFGFIVFLYDKFKDKLRLFKFYIPAMFAVFFLLYGGAALAQYEFSKNNYKSFTIDSAYAASYEWLNKNTELNSVVGSDSLATNGELMLYSHNKIFIPSGGNTSISNDEIWNRARWMAAIFDMPKSKFQTLMNENYYFFLDYFHDHSFDSYFSDTGKKVADDTLHEETEAYNNLLKQKIDFRHLPYKLDYLLIGPREQNLSGPLDTRLSGFEIVYNKDNIRIYKLDN